MTAPLSDAVPSTTLFAENPLQGFLPCMGHAAPSNAQFNNILRTATAAPDPMQRYWICFP
ncbi:MAG: hypothetical protein F8N36_09465 [Desulfovibrio sp.]|uniref:hypothetical protein n=1 Tax=Desulfovibrio sp. TaxID=885 RepID=UPI00135EBD52|nr:hypothetical protein [Desulfovibrio sp.]MTJ93074.1 hypothetical protein [Desulfovibrio sp.]